MIHRIFLTLFFLCSNSVWAAETLSLETYLKQVQENNGTYLASSRISEGAKESAAIGKLLTRPNAYGSYRYTNDQKPQIFSSAFGDQTISHYATGGVTQKTDLGLEVKAGYEFNDIQINGINPAFIPSSHYRTASPKVEIRQPLLRDGFGREIRAQKELLRSSAMTTSHAERFKMGRVLQEAKKAYWNLYFTRQTVAVRKEILQGGRKILDLTRNRTDKGLGDRADFLQAQAAYQLKELELKAAQDSEKVLIRRFNFLRGESDDTLTAKLVPAKRMVLPPLPASLPTRSDMKSLQEASRAARAQAKIAREQAAPTLDLVAGAALNGLNPETQPTLEESFTENPTVTAGANLSVPLSFGLTRKVRKGYQQEAKGYERAVVQQQFENDQTYLELREQLKEAKARLTLAQSIANAQREKFLNEQKKLDTGRTTTFQILTFQEDLGVAQIAPYQIEAEVVALETELELYKDPL